MSGFRAWLIQRLSAIYLVVFILFVAMTLLLNDINSQIWKQWFETTWVQLAVLLFALSLLLHAWVGMRDIIVDYIHPLGLRLFLLSLSAIFLILNGFWLLSILWRLA